MRRDFLRAVVNIVPSQKIAQWLKAIINKE
jgi:hypothetical protein